MIKPLLILINTVSVFLFSFFFGDSPVSVIGNIPKNAKPGTEFVAELKIAKGAIGGFAKLQFEVPQGFTVKELESKGGNFSFANNIGKIIWTAIPNDADFVVKFAVSTEASVSGLKTLTSKFSYVNNNVKEVIEMTPAEIIIGDESSVASTVVTASETQTTQPLTAVETNTVTPVASSTENTTTQNPTEPSSTVMCVRAISKGATENEFNVQVKIKKPSIKGFAKYQEILPAGYTAKGVATSGSSFSVSDGKAKFVWVSLPSEDEMIITYVLEKSASAASDASIIGEFSYLENDQTKKVKVPSEVIKVSGDIVSSTNVITNTTNTTTTIVTDNTSKTDVVANNTSQTNDVANNTQTDNTTAKKTDNSTTNNTVVAKKEGSVAYHVQIGAFTNAIASEVLAKKFNINEKIKSEMAEGFSKFMIGNFGEYKVARTNRETMKEKGCRSAFVVAYNGAKRITVQEALMITNQKWFK